MNSNVTTKQSDTCHDNMGINVPKATSHAYLMSIRMSIRRAIDKKYNISCTVHAQYDFAGEKLLVVTWGGDYAISISESSLGPARLFDFMAEFNTKIRNKYPEVLL